MGAPAAYRAGRIVKNHLSVLLRNGTSTFLFRLNQSPGIALES